MKTPAAKMIAKLKAPTKKVVVPPIKSQGIKTKLVPWIMDLVQIADQPGTWIEPFLGTGVVGFNSGYNNAILNDTNPHIISFYEGIQKGTITSKLVKEFLQFEGKALSEADEAGYVHFRVIKNRFNTDFSPLDFLFLSRAGFNGMMRFNKKGLWNIPFCKKPDRFAQAYVTKIVNQVDKVSSAIKQTWHFNNKSFADIIPLATKDDIIYCDPPYYGRYVDYYNGWTEADEELLYNLLAATPAKFILSTWHHNAHRKNEMIDRFWSKFNVATKDHFYHSGGKAENRQSVVEALVYNFDADFTLHNHNLNKVEHKVEQLSMFA
jgi:DNA adenine methylase